MPPFGNCKMMKCEQPSSLQNERELRDFIALLTVEQVKSYLEIGGKFGGSLWKIGCSLPSGSRIVSVDLPHGKKRYVEELPHLINCVTALKQKGYDAHLIVGDSTAPEVITKVRILGPFDACFIDANHTEPFVRKDWATYGPLCRIIAFHDINHMRWIPPERIPIQVKKVWDEIKHDHRYCEIKHDADINGIGVLWR